MSSGESFEAENSSRRGSWHDSKRDDRTHTFAGSKLEGPHAKDCGLLLKAEGQRNGNLSPQTTEFCHQSE